jgi:hypothetical protein
MFLLLACEADDGAGAAPPPDLTVPLAAGEVRAGRIVDGASLFGGISAEGQIGDFLLYNERVRFVVQDAGDSDYYVDYGGGLIDADIVRPAGEPGRDILDELTPMFGLARIPKAETVQVLADGTDGLAAIVRVEGPAAPMLLATGALENPDLVPDMDMRFRTDWVLRPDETSIQAVTTVYNDDDATAGQLGLLALYAQDVAESWAPGEGRRPEEGSAVPWIGALAHRNEAAFGLVAEEGLLEQGTIAQILGAAAPGLMGFSETLDAPSGGEVSWTARVAVGPDLATISGEARRIQGAGGQLVRGTVTAGGAPVAGARVHVLDEDGAPDTVAVTGSDGAWSAVAPLGHPSFVASGRGTGLQVDLPDGHAWIAPYDASNEDALTTLSEGAPASFAMAEGYGAGDATTDTALTLTPPGLVRVTVADGGPAVARFEFAAGDPAVIDERLVPGRYSGTGALAFIRDGAMDIAVEPGDYTLIVHRGVREEVHVERVHVVSGGVVEVSASLATAWTAEGVVSFDPHEHAAPSGDGGIAMEDRILAAAANGIDVHVGTDHDHVADYRPIIPAEGLEDRLKSVVAVEVSPVLRGHFNSYPAALDEDAANHGAPRWWQGYADTEEIFGWMRALVGDDGVVQANHPVGNSGMFSFAEYSITNGSVGSGEHWSDDFDAMEVNNSGDYTAYFPFYLDLVSRGREVTPTGVSDSHTHTSGGFGLNQTFLYSGGTLAEFDDDALRAAMAASATVVSRGPMILATVDGAWAPGVTFTGEADLTVQVLAPSWMPVEQVVLWEDGVAAETVACPEEGSCTVEFSLSPVDDAAYVVVAESLSRPMVYAHAGELAWAMTAAIKVDVDGKGWAPPLASLGIE